MSVPVYNKLVVLQRISPPLGPETRGPLIAVEGVAGAAAMRQVSGVVERALAGSGECEVKVWSDLGLAAMEGGEEGKKASIAVGGGGGEDDVEMGEGDAAAESRRGSAAVSTTAVSPVLTTSGVSPMVKHLQTVQEWHVKSAEILRYITTPLENNSNSNNINNAKLIPVALIPGYRLTITDRFGYTIPIQDQYIPIDHWHWMATLWRGVVGPDLVVLVREHSAGPVVVTTGSGENESSIKFHGTSSPVEFVAPGLMVVWVNGGRVDEKTERRLGFEVLEWVRAGVFREPYSSLAA